MFIEAEQLNGTFPEMDMKPSPTSQDLPSSEKDQAALRKRV